VISENRREEIRAQRAAVRQLRRLIGGVDRNARRKYIRDFRQDFAAYQETASYDDLLVKGFRSDIIYIGDYHTLAACQEFCNRFLGDMIQRSAHVILAMEMVYGRQQRILDEWMASRIDDDEFRQRLRYDEEWGYDWPSYRAILSTARTAGVPVVGIDCDPRTGFRMIRRRDIHAAERIAEAFLRDPEAKVVVFMGESHLARNHLPARVAREVARRQMEKRSLTIVQNVDELYWQRAESGQDESEVVRVDTNRYCVFNATPLAKYESYRQVIELWRDHAGDDEIDLTPTVHGMILTMLRFLKVNRYRKVVGHREGLPIRLVDVFPEVYAREDHEFVRGMMQRYDLEGEQIEQVLGHLERAGSCFVPRVNAIFIGTFDLAHAGEEASHFVNSALKGELYESWNGKPLADHDRFYSAVMEESIGYFGSKLIDPARNHFFETDFYRFYGKEPGEIEERTGYRFEEFRTIIDFILLHKKFERDYSARQEVPEAILAGIRSRGSRFRILTHELGYFLGQQIYDGYQKGLVSHGEIAALYRQRWDGPSGALSAYLEWAEKLAPLGGG
jgi:hypothetical protein